MDGGKGIVDVIAAMFFNIAGEAKRQMHVFRTDPVRPLQARRQNLKALANVKGHGDTNKKADHGMFPWKHC
jgi:hypothetical protein